MLNALIIGAGQIAAGYDNPSDGCVLTHAHAILKHKKFNLLGFFDVNFKKAESAAKKWNSNAFRNLNEVENVDVAVVCTPDGFHLQSVENALRLEPKLIVLEKPLSNNLADAKKIVEISKNTPILVNFSRRFVKEFQELAAKIKDGEFGEFQTGTGLYGKGFIHNGSHMIDLLKFLIGEIKKIDEKSAFVDFYEDDPTKTAEITFFNSKKFFMQGLDCNNFTIFEMDLIFDNARIRILESGNKIEIFTPEENKDLPGYKFLAKKCKIKTELSFAMFNLYENVYKFLAKGEKLKSCCKSALEELAYV